MDIITRAEAKAQGLKRYYTGKPCKHGHVAERHTSSAGCLVCSRERDAAYRAANIEAIRETARAWCKANKARKAETDRAWYKANKARKAETDRVWNEANKARKAETDRAWCKANKARKAETARVWLQTNLGKHNANSAKRRARKLNQTPENADLELIQLFYEEARALTKSTGIPHHVDHIIPLARGGLHHEDNLQILTAEENLRKGAKLPESA